MSSIAFPKETWEQASPASQGVEGRRLQAALDTLAGALAGHGGIDEMAITRHGRLIWQGGRADCVHNVWSVTKSFVGATCLGLLIDDGACSLDTPAHRHVPALAEKYPAVTLRHLATMTSGYDAVGGGYGTDPMDGSKTPFDPDRPMFQPGSMYRYWDDAQRMFGLVLTRIAGEPLEELFRRRVAEAIGLSNWSFALQAEVDGVAVNDAASNMQVSALELARLGLLYLCGGQWQGRRIISESFVAQATQPHVPADMPWDGTFSPRQATLDGRGFYGLNWWANGVGADGRRYWPAGPADAYKASGLHDNVCIVIPSSQVVIARTSTTARHADSRQVWSDFLHALCEAITG